MYKKGEKVEAMCYNDDKRLVTLMTVVAQVPSSDKDINDVWMVEFNDGSTGKVHEYWFRRYEIRNEVFIEE